MCINSLFVTSKEFIIICATRLNMNKQKRCADVVQVDRVSYLLQEIYGIENKNNQETKVNWNKRITGSSRKEYSPYCHRL